MLHNCYCVCVTILFTLAPKGLNSTVESKAYTYPFYFSDQLRQSTNGLHTTPASTEKRLQSHTEWLKSVRRDRNVNDRTTSSNSSYPFL